MKQVSQQELNELFGHGDELSYHDYHKLKEKIAAQEMKTHGLDIPPVPGKSFPGVEGYCEHYEIWHEISGSATFVNKVTTNTVHIPAGRVEEAKAILSEGMASVSKLGHQQHEVLPPLAYSGNKPPLLPSIEKVGNLFYLEKDAKHVKETLAEIDAKLEALAVLGPPTGKSLFIGTPNINVSLADMIAGKFSESLVSTVAKSLAAPVAQILAGKEASKAESEMAQNIYKQEVYKIGEQHSIGEVNDHGEIVYWDATHEKLPVYLAPNQLADMPNDVRFEIRVRDRHGNVVADKVTGEMQEKAQAFPWHKLLPGEVIDIYALPIPGIPTPKRAMIIDMATSLGEFTHSSPVIVSLDLQIVADDTPVTAPAPWTDFKKELPAKPQLSGNGKTEFVLRNKGKIGARLGFWGPLSMYSGVKKGQSLNLLEHFGPSHVVVTNVTLRVAPTNSAHVEIDADVIDVAPAIAANVPIKYEIDMELVKQMVKPWTSLLEEFVYVYEVAKPQIPGIRRKKIIGLIQSAKATLDNAKKAQMK